MKPAYNPRDRAPAPPAAGAARGREPVVPIGRRACIPPTRPLAATIAGIAAILAAALVSGLAGCSAVKQAAVNGAGNVLAGGGTTYASDDDPELVWQAVPFGLKTIEGLLAQSPRHQGLLLAAARGLTGDAYGAFQQEAEPA